MSVWVARLSGFFGSVQRDRLRRRERGFRPSGVVTVAEAIRGACIPKRGSGPSVRSVTVPSGSVIVRVPSVPMTVTVWPSGSPQAQ